jgi:hypothetical protein
MAARRPDRQRLYDSIEAFVRDGKNSLWPILLEFTENHIRVVEIARSEIRPSIVEHLSDEELIQQISAAVRDTSRALQVVPEDIPIVARSGSGEESRTSSISTSSGTIQHQAIQHQAIQHQAEGNYAVEFENGSVGTISIDPASHPAPDEDLTAAQMVLSAETVSPSSSWRQNTQANSSSGESHSLS